MDAVTEMQKRVAEAITSAFFDHQMQHDDASAMDPLILASAAIKAMREPTERMCDEGSLSYDYDGWDGPSVCWTYMIDGALGKGAFGQ